MPLDYSPRNKTLTYRANILIRPSQSDSGFTFNILTCGPKTARGIHQRLVDTVSTRTSGLPHTGTQGMGRRKNSLMVFPIGTVTGWPMYPKSTGRDWGGSSACQASTRSTCCRGARPLRG